jgi:hypothetical protein
MTSATQTARGRGAAFARAQLDPVEIYRRRRYLVVVVVLGTAAAAGLVGTIDRLIQFGLLLLGVLAVSFLLRRLPMMLAILIIIAMLIPSAIGTGTAVVVNAVTLAIPLFTAVWCLNMIVKRDISLMPSRTTLPLFLFLLAGLISIVVGNIIWDPTVPHPRNFILVQMAQWAIFAFAGLAFWLAANIFVSVTLIKRVAYLFLLLGGVLAAIRVLPGGYEITYVFTTGVLDRAPFWMLLSALAAGQLLYNKKLGLPFTLFLIAVLAVVVIYAFRLQDERNSNWVGVGAVLVTIAWLRFPRWRWLMLALLFALVVSGTLWNAIYTFAGGDAKWYESGGARLVLIQRVIELTMRNPITGLGPAAYRPYGLMQPLFYRGADWVQPQLNSHNNYVDIFSHTGLLGLALFLWFMIELGIEGLRLRPRFVDGFAAGYVNGMIAAWVGCMALMMLADWILPFVYNISFHGFQASAIIWVFLGGLVAMASFPIAQSGSPAT